MMATNKIKDLPIDVSDIFITICDAIKDQLEQLDITGAGDDGDTEFEMEDVRVDFKDGQFIANIDLQRISGKFVSNQDLEDYVLTQINSEKITVEVEMLA
jgi:hypothetical protein